ncbi:MAG TPA: orotidine-5'-phosphate decarboxylase [Firmicutes bacterium]|nr:orotidine-5'-phosphate decarboxylase [Bacillota bacterium]
MRFVNSSERIIAALDLPGRERVERFLDQLPELRFVKVGMELFYAAGPTLVLSLKERGLKVFLDLKVHDIPNTAFGAIRSLSGLGSDFINVHCAGGLEMMKQAVRALKGGSQLIGVTQLTSIDQRALNEELKIGGTVEESVLHYAQLAKRAGLAGVVCSPWEARAVKEKCGSDFLTITPGVRPQGSAGQDQKRIMTPAEAVQAGSDYLVIGRPIVASADPRGAFLKIAEEIEAVA